MATVTQVIDRAGNDLGVLRLNQTLQAQDLTRITAGYNEVYAQLRKDGLATWASTAAVPDEIVPHLVALIADNCLNTYGVSKDRYERIKLAVKFALREIRKFTAPDYISQSEPSDF